MQRLQVLLLVTALSCSTQGAKLPANFKTCHRSDPDVNSCLKVAIQATLPLLASGYKELNVQPLEPLIIPSATIGEGAGRVSLVQHYTDFRLYNLTRSVINSVETLFEADEIILVIKAYTSEFVVKSDYEIDGHVLQLPVRGKGKCTITLKDVKTETRIAGKFVQRKGKTYLEITDVKDVPTPEKIEYNFEGLLGDEELGQQINNVLNDNWKDVYDDIKSGYEELFSAVIKHSVESFFSKVPCEDVFPN